jgi:hypothetical protein
MKDRKTIPMVTFVCCKLQRDAICVDRCRGLGLKKNECDLKQASIPKRDLNEWSRKAQKKQSISATHWSLLAEIRNDDILL